MAVIWYARRGGVGIVRGRLTGFTFSGDSFFVSQCNIFRWNYYFIASNVSSEGIMPWINEVCLFFEGSNQRCSCTGPGFLFLVKSAGFLNIPTSSASVSLVLMGVVFLLTINFRIFEELYGLSIWEAVFCRTALCYFFSETAAACRKCMFWVIAWHSLISWNPCNFSHFFGKSHEYWSTSWLQFYLEKKIILAAVLRNLRT